MPNDRADTLAPPAVMPGPVEPATVGAPHRGRVRTLRGTLRWLLIAPLLPLSLLSGAIVWKQYQDQRDEVYANLARTAHAVSIAIDQEVDIARTMLDTLGGSELIDRRDWPAFHRLATRALRDRTDAWIALSERSGTQVMRTFAPPDAPPTFNPGVLARTHAETEWRGRMLPVSTQGLTERVLAEGRMSNTGLYFGAVIRRPAVAIGVPVFRGLVPSHVLILGFAPDRLLRLIRETSGNGQRVTLIDAEGRIIASSRDPEDGLGRTVSPQLRELVMTRQDGFREGPNRLGEPVVQSFRRVAATDWTVVVSTPRDEAYASARSAALVTGLMLLALVAVGALTARTLWLRLAPPLVAMGRSAQAIQRGALPKLPRSGIAEIDELGRLLREAASAEGRSRDEALRRAVAESEAQAARREADARDASERLLRRVIDNLFTFVGLLDARGVLLEANRAPLDVAGLRREDVIGRDFWECPWWSYDPRVAAGVREAVGRAARGEAVRYDVAIQSVPGESIVIDFQLSPLREPDGTIGLLIASAADISERTRTEAALREADRQKDEFLAILSHELRNPLAPIRAASHMIRRRVGGDPALGEAASIIERQVRQLTRLTDDLLEVARITTGRIELQRRPEAVATLLGAAIEAARPAIDAAGHRLEVAMPDEPLWVDGDAARLSQAILNLLHNAARYTPRGGRIEVGAARDGDRVRIRVSDTGIGIDAETLPRIFGMFVQGPGGASAGGGLGIGLGLASRLVGMHGGTLDATSDGPGRGATFEIALPLCPAPAAPGATPAAGAAAGVAARSVLVVDDNVDAATTLREVLALDGHRVAVAHRGADALAAVEASRPDVVVLDIGLPDLDGLEVARRLRARWGQDCPRLIALSGWGQAADKLRAAEAGFERHLTKPVDPEVLAAAIGAAPPPGTA